MMMTSYLLLKIFDQLNKKSFFTNGIIQVLQHRRKRRVRPKEVMLKNKPHLVQYHESILISLWAFQLTLVSWYHQLRKDLEFYSLQYQHQTWLHMHMLSFKLWLTICLKDINFKPAIISIPCRWTFIIKTYSKKFSFPVLLCLRNRFLFWWFKVIDWMLTYLIQCFHYLHHFSLFSFAIPAFKNIFLLIN